jgi:phosphatidate cytidylyltransferase
MSVILGLPANVVYATVAIYALLVIASIVVGVLRWKNPGERYSELASRTDSWWWMIGAFTLCILLNQTVAIFFLAFISYLALKEYLSLIPTRRIDREVLLFAYLAIPIQYYWAAIDWYGMFIVFVPVWMFLFLPPLLVLRGRSEGFLRAVGTISSGLMMTVFTLSHMAWLLVSGDVVNPVAGGVGLLFFLVVLTQFNDVAQYCWGKLFGRHKVTPHVSPKKTWEGLIGGVATTTLVAALAGPYLTPLDMRWSALAGLILGIAGFLGDITMSAMKRDLGVKDTGGLIPGHGGILDRVDSPLTRHRCSCTSSATSTTHEQEPAHETAQVPVLRRGGARRDPCRARSYRAASRAAA